MKTKNHSLVACPTPENPRGFRVAFKEELNKVGRGKLLW